MAEKIRYTRKDLKGPDEFISTFGRVVEWCKENRAKVTAAVLGIAAVVALGLGTKAYLQWEENKSSRELWPHLNRAREFLLSPAEADPEKMAALEQFLAAHVNVHPSTRAAVYARYYLGSIAFHRGNYGLAASQFRAGSESGKDEGIMKYLLREGVARSLEAKGDYAAAAAAYRAAQGFADAEMKAQSQVGEARTLALSGRKSDAIALYRQLLKDSPETRVRDLVELRLAQLE
ncbi:MAG: tetratricopeptide repeat protein [Deltaproteobacteria bacterium]|nr:tetratricopeptide repeat protein [Deltaproteobacteria bacterium]